MRLGLVAAETLVAVSGLSELPTGAARKLNLAIVLPLPCCMPGVAEPANTAQPRLPPALGPGGPRDEPWAG